MSETIQHQSIAPIAAAGDIVTIDLDLRPENGFVPEPLFDSVGRISFILGYGNYLPAIHELVEGCIVGEIVGDVAVDAGWGGRRKELVVRVPLSKLPPNHELIAGETTLTLQGGLQVLVTAIDEDTVVLDANPPLAGSSYTCGFTVVAIEKGFTHDNTKKNQRRDSSVCIETRKGERMAFSDQSDHYKVATFALGCFWGAELAFMRLPGVVGTRVGYSQGVTLAPTYEQVSTGRTKHREAILVDYDDRVVSYEQLVQVAFHRLQDFQDPLQHSTSSLHASSSSDDEVSGVFDLSELFREEDNDDNDHYRNGIYYHSEEQRQVAAKLLEKGNRYRIEILQATVFYEAEENHQQYLYKGGQSARKNAKEKIRCFG